MKRAYVYDTLYGKLVIAENGSAVTDIFYGSIIRLQAYAEQESVLIRETAGQINEYLRGRRRSFDIPVFLEGEPFEQAVWKALQRIPFARTITYAELAEMAGAPRAVRAAGWAASRNPVPIIIPCHRVLGAGGKLVGYAGGLEMKKALLDLERDNDIIN